MPEKRATNNVRCMQLLYIPSSYVCWKQRKTWTIRIPWQQLQVCLYLFFDWCVDV